jgi:hypothetical protein
LTAAQEAASRAPCGVRDADRGVGAVQPVVQRYEVAWLTEPKPRYIGHDG